MDFLAISCIGNLQLHTALLRGSRPKRGKASISDQAGQLNVRTLSNHALVPPPGTCAAARAAARK